MSSGMLQIGVILTIIFLEGSYSSAIVNDQNTTTFVEYVLLQKDHPCSRTCIAGHSPMVCRYNFTIEWYQTMSKACYSCPFDIDDCKRTDCVTGDGRKRTIVVVNRQMPGPSIEVCLGDEVIVHVHNHLMTDTTTIHWHGHHQRGTPYMDGVPFVTQCPIQPGNTFTYKFPATNIGTHFWHSHSGMQRADGAFGPFIVRQPIEQNPHKDLYDYDLSSHVITVLDWEEVTGMQKFVAHHHSDGDNKPTSILVNGKGRFLEFSTGNESSVYAPVERFYVNQGFRYRFRVINAEFLNCPIEISIDNHTLTVISTDGNDVEAVEAESVVTYAGERFDFIVHANQSDDLYWMRFRGLMDCDDRFKSAHQVAILQYSSYTSDFDYPGGIPSYSTAHKEGLQVNALNVGTEERNVSISMPHLKSLDPWDESLKETPDFKYFLSYDFYKKDNPHFHKPNVYGFHNGKCGIAPFSPLTDLIAFTVSDSKQRLLTPQLNHISMKLLSIPLLSGRAHLKQEMFCNESTVSNCEETYCECTHVVQVPLGSVVEMILVDKGFAYDANHPFHLHGHSFRVVGMERLGKNVTIDKVIQLDNENLLKRNLENPSVKDTVTVPDGGYTIIRFVASNPGYWFFHCHIEFHVEIGMALVFKFGEHEDMPPVPKDFPQCGDYQVTHHPSRPESLWSSLFGSSSSSSPKIQLFTLMVPLFFLEVLR